MEVGDKMLIMLRVVDALSVRCREHANTYTRIGTRPKIKNTGSADYSIWHPRLCGFWGAYPKRTKGPCDNRNKVCCGNLRKAPCRLPPSR